MSSSADNPATTTWLYNHFAGKFFGHRNDQDLRAFGCGLRQDRRFARAEILAKTDRARFFVDDFRALMSVVWMVLLYPNVHRYTAAERKPLLQDQDHVVIHRGLRDNGLI